MFNNSSFNILNKNSILNKLKLTTNNNSDELYNSPKESKISILNFP